MKHTLLALGALVAVGCSGTPQYPFEDELGRQCVLDCGSDPCTITCDVEVPEVADCSEGLEPGFFVTGSFDGRPTEMCVWCLDDDGNGWSRASPPHCGRLVCEEAVDCGFGGQICVEGFCRGDPAFDPLAYAPQQPGHE